MSFRLLSCVISAFSSLLLAGCVQYYEPEILHATGNLLVVDGFINSTDSTYIRLARSLELKSTNKFLAETGALLSIETEQGQRYPLRETVPGHYVVSPINLPPGQRVRLRIRTRDDHDYASNFRIPKLTPPIDNLEGRIQPEGLQLYISTHDATNQTQYYRWEYVETWEFYSAFESYYEYIGNNAFARRTESAYHCWRTEPSTNIITTSTVRLSQDAVRDFRLLFIPSSSGRFRHKYSMLVRQYALSQEEFDYWEAVKKNTENIGTLFDPLPSQVQGNVHCLSHPDEPVLGFVGATSVVEERLFIDRQQLPLEWARFNEGYEQCTEFYIYEPRINFSYEELFNILGYEPISQTNGAYTYQTKECVDCRLKGSNVKPSFWP